MKRLFIIILCVFLCIQVQAQAQYAEQRARLEDLAKSVGENYQFVSFSKLRDESFADLIYAKIDFFMMMVKTDLQLINIGNNFLCSPEDRYNDDMAKLDAFVSLYEKYLDKGDDIASSVFLLKYSYTQEGKRYEGSAYGNFSLEGQLWSISADDKEWSDVSFGNGPIPEIQAILYR